MSITRRLFLRRTAAAGAAAATVPTVTGGASAEATRTPSVDAFLASASAVDRARFHAHGLADAMNEAIPGSSHSVHIDWKYRFALINDPRSQEGGSK